jgi:predicted dehydrogenase
MTDIRVALIGAGLFGRKHVETLASEPTFKLVAIADPTPVAADYARQCDVPYFAEITDVQAFTSNAVREFAVEDTAAVCLRFGNGALGTITVSDTVAAPWSWELTSGENPAYARSTDDCYLVAGTDGSLTVPRLELSRYEGERGWYAPLSKKRIDVGYVDPLVTQMRHFARVIQGQEEPRITGADATRTLAVTVGIHQAAASGRPVVIE